MKKIHYLYLGLALVLAPVSCGKDDPNPPDDPTTNPPTIASFSPTEGTPGATVEIIGTNFSATASENTVKFNGTSATVSSATATKLTVSVPNGATSGKIAVTVDGETAQSSGTFTVTEPSANAPTIASFSPTEGTPGTTVEILGTNFSTVKTENTVEFNGTEATVSIASATLLTVEVPNGATSGKITVTVDGQTAQSSTDFTVLDPTTVSISGFAPDQENVGAQVIIEGANFDPNTANNTVEFNGVAAQVTAANGTNLTVTVPEGATTGTITVTVGQQTVESATAFTVGPWRQLTTPSWMDYPIRGGNMAVLKNNNDEDEIHFGFGRYNDGSIAYTNTIYVYDIENDTWKNSGVSEAAARYNAASFVLNNKWHIITGKNGNGDIDDSWSYDPTTGTWENLGVTAYGSGLSSFCGDIACFVYGIEEDFAEGKLKSFNGSIWVDKPSALILEKGILDAVGFRIGSQGYIVTGEGAVHLDLLLKYNMTTDSWAQLAPVPFTLRTEAIGVGMGTKAYVGLGIDDTQSKYLDDIWEYNQGDNTWSQKSSFPGGGRQGAAAVAHGEHIYILGGVGNAPQEELKTFWRYTPALDN
ncbi:MAG: IPT/TIG domain-containing protein [Flavobacteriaceae bacterium]|uniref:IPT/TIG domain-containing protein n=1 Tax=Flagellimonas sp. SN16 TaxID=3415142 RepID=UPI003C4A20D5|nr:IPT/TIG domain-containing protein [Flavobacteriaceae bacterium]